MYVCLFIYPLLVALFSWYAVSNVAAGIFTGCTRPSSWDDNWKQCLPMFAFVIWLISFRSNHGQVSIIWKVFSSSASQQSGQLFGFNRRGRPTSQQWFCSNILPVSIYSHTPQGPTTSIAFLCGVFGFICCWGRVIKFKKSQHKHSCNNSSLHRLCWGKETRNLD